MSSPGTDRRSQSGLALLVAHPGLARYLAAYVLAQFAFQMQTVAVGWQVYDLTRNPFDLGLVGLTQFAPALALVLVTGTVADRYPRKLVLGICLTVQSLCAAALLSLAGGGLSAPLPIFAVLFLFGATRAFYNAARQAIVPNLVPSRDLPGAIALTSTTGQAATICGPVAGGLLYGLSAQAAYGGTLICLLLAALLMLTVPTPAQIRAKGRATWETLSGGFRYIWREKIVLGAISLDLFAVLLGGATALLPVFARDVLDVGPAGLGALRSAPAIGAILVGGWLIWRPIRDHAGIIMFASVFLFAGATAVFAFSSVVWLSVLALIAMGGADMVSINVRAALIQLWTPDELRGRVNAVNQVFIGASNEVGGFRAGTMAALIGPVAAVAIGAAGTVAVAGLWMRWFPGLRVVRQLERD